MRTKALTLALASIFVLAASVRGQNGPDNDPSSASGPTTEPFSTGGPDSINLYNGQLGIPVPIGPSYPVGPHLRFQAMLTYNSHVWELGHPASQSGSFTYTPISGNPALGIGWNFSLGAIKVCTVSTTVFCYVGPDGGQHVFDETDAKRGSGFSKTSDGARLSLRNNGASGFDMWDEAGNHYTFGTAGHVTGYDDAPTSFTHDFGRGRDGWYLTKVEDPFLNNYQVSYFSNSPTTNSPCTSGGVAWTYSGTPLTLGAMQCPSSTTAPLSWIPSAITIPFGIGGTQTISLTLNSSTHMIQSFAFPIGLSQSSTWTLTPGTAVAYSNASSGTINLQTLGSISISSGLTGSPKYSFSYWGDGCGQGALMKELTLPGGATIDYQYRTYSFYHTRTVRFGPGCSVVVIPDGQSVVGSPLPTGCPGFVGGPPLLPAPGACNTTDIDSFLDTLTVGVGRRTMTVGSIVGVTDYFQYSMPYGEYGTSSSSNCDHLGHCGAESLTIVVAPEVDLNGGVAGTGRRSSRAYLFTVDSTGTAGGTEGAPIEDRVFDVDASIAEMSYAPPMCGPFASPVQPFCSEKAIRVTQRTFEYGDDVFSTGKRRVLTEHTYYAPTNNVQLCPGCKDHLVVFSNTSGRNWDASDGTGNGRHYNVESHSGTLGGDARTITTTWAPQVNGTTYLPDLLTERKDVLGSSTRDELYEFNATTGFAAGSLVWDQPSSKAWANCRFKDSAGNVAQELTKTFAAGTLPSNTYCSTTYGSTMPSVGTDQDMFGQNYTYKNGEILTANWLSGTSTVGWNRFTLTRSDYTGWVTAAFDTAGAETDYAYDSIGRVTTVTPIHVRVGDPSEIPTTVAYSLTQTTSSRSGGVGLTTYDESDFDSAGRLTKQRRLMPGTQYSKRFFAYDGSGAQIFASEWVADATLEPINQDKTTTCVFSGGNLPTKRPSAAPGTYQLCFDPFGRPQQIVGANFSSLVTVDRTDATSYSDTKEVDTVACVGGTLSNTGSCTGGADAATTSVRDAYGRVLTVTEPTTDVTKYAYDVNSNLTCVKQGGTMDMSNCTSNSGGQLRSFNYNSFNFLLSENTPEKGGTVSYTYGSLGNLQQMTEPPGTLTTLRCYDAAGRVASLWSNESGGAPACGGTTGRLYGAYGYDQNASSTNFSLGKLSIRQGFNFPFAQQAPITELFKYAEIGGRLSERDIAVGAGVTTTPFNAGENAFPVQKWTYNTLGLIKTRLRPSAATETLTYDAGLPTSETLSAQTVFSSVGYSPAGALASWTAGNSVITTIAQDASFLPRPASIATSGTSPNFSTGAYVYDGAGNILSIGASTTKDTFTYDSLSRLTSAAYFGGLGSQFFCYDRYGNRVSKSTTTSSCAGTVWSDNRVPPGTTNYDGRGNMIANGSETLTYDGLNRQTRDIVSGIEWEYIYDGGGERILKYPASIQVLRREMARYVVQGRGEKPCRVIGDCTPPETPIACSGSFSHYFTDVNCSDPDSLWIDKLAADGITTGCGSGIYCPGTTIPRNQMAVFMVLGTGHTPVPPGSCTTPTRYGDVPCGDPYWGSIEELAILGITAGCQASPPLFCPTNPIPENQMLAFMQAPTAWPTYMPIARGAIYTVRDEAGRIQDEQTSTQGGDTAHPPVPNGNTRDNLFLGNLLVASNVISTLGGTLGYNYYHADHLGTPRLVTDAGHAMVETWKYWPYGDDTGTGTTAQRIRFATMERDTEATHYYDHARSEDFNLGRFLTPDPLVMSSIGPQSWNRYAYASGNPLRLLDPTGLAPTITVCWTTFGGTDANPIVGKHCIDIPITSPPGGDHPPAVDVSNRGGGGGAPSAPPGMSSKSFGKCVQDSADYFSLQQITQRATGGALGNGVLADAFLGSSASEAMTFANWVNAKLSGGSGPSNREVLYAGAGELITHGTEKSLKLGAKSLPTLAISASAAYYAAVETPTLSASVAAGVDLSATVPLGSIAAAGEAGMKLFGTWKMAYDASIAAASALICGIR